jgi:hypothetical protein
MSADPKKYYILVNVLVIFLASALMSGCASSPPPRTWSLTYNEKVMVRTEPSGARIYVQDNYRGTSPVEVTLNGGELTVKQWGSSLPLDGSIGAGYWTIKAFLDGHEPASIKILCGETTAYRRAIMELRPSAKNTLPSVVVGHNAVVLHLPSSGYSRGSYQSGTSSGRSSAAYNEAKREYEVALSDYNEAVAELDEARNMRSLSNMSFGTLMGGSKLDRAVGLLNQGTTHLSLQEAERNVQIARERLERAKARLDAMNWK